MQDCGGSKNQPICLYDFTVKHLNHDYLSFSTRHLGHSMPSEYIDEDYFSLEKIDTDDEIRQRNPRISNTDINLFQTQTSLAKSTSHIKLDGELKDYNVLGNSTRNSNHGDLAKKQNVSSAQIPKNIIPIEDGEEERKSNKSDDSVELPSVSAIPVLQVTNDNTLPSVLPIYRGMHICGKHFTDKFKETMLLDSMQIANTLNSKECGTAESIPAQIQNLFKNKYLYP